MAADPHALYAVADPNQEFSKNCILDPNPDSFGGLLRRTPVKVPTT